MLKFEGEVFRVAATSGVAALGSVTRWIDRLIPSRKGQLDYAEERAVVAFTEQIAEIMETDAVSRAELASRLGVTKGRVTRMLSGGNMTIRTLGRILFALDNEITGVRLVPFGSATLPVSQFEHESSAEASASTASSPAIDTDPQSSETLAA